MGLARLIAVAVGYMYVRNILLVLHNAFTKIGLLYIHMEGVSGKSDIRKSAQLYQFRGRLQGVKHVILIPVKGLEIDKGVSLGGHFVQAFEGVKQN